MFQQAMDILSALLQDLGFKINYDKYIKPSQEIVFLGIQINSVSQTLTIPSSKLTDMKQNASSWLNKRSASKREIQSLVGKISWAAKCIKAIRPCLRSLIDLQKHLARPSHRIRLPHAVKLDIRLFVDWCVRFNGVTLIPITGRPLPHTTLFTDASLVAGAAYHNRDFVYSCWAADYPIICNKSIYVKELCAIMLAF